MVDLIISVVKIFSFAFNEQKDIFIIIQISSFIITNRVQFKKNQINTNFSRYIYDLNILHFHTKSRFPGLFVRLPNGKRAKLRISEQTVLLQPGKLVEFMTGGVQKAEYYEAYITQETNLVSIKQNKSWRVTSTLVAMLNDDAILQPMQCFMKISNFNYKSISVKECFLKGLYKLSYVRYKM